MKVITKAISDLKFADRNVRIHGDRQIKEYIRSIEMFGQVRPLVIDEDNVVICGNGLLQAFQKMGKETAECYVITGLSKNKKKKLMLADNKIYELGINNQAEFDNMLKDLAGDIDIPGYDEELLKALSDSLTENDFFIPSNDNNVESQETQGKTPTATMTIQKPAVQQINSGGEISTENFSDDKFNCTCPKCGFKFNV